MLDSSAFANNARIHFFRLSMPEPGKVLLRRPLGLGFGCGIVGLLLLLAGIGLGVALLFGSAPKDNSDPMQVSSGFKMVIFLLFGGVLGLGMLLGTHSILIDSSARAIERCRLLGFMRSVTPLGQASVVRFPVFLVPAGFPVCSLEIEPESGKSFDLGVQLQLSSVDALTMAKLAQWIAEHFQLTFRVDVTQNVDLDQLPSSELVSLLKTNLAS